MSNESPSLSQLLSGISTAHMTIDNYQNVFRNAFEPVAHRALESFPAIATLGSYDIYIEPLHIEVRQITSDVFNVSLILNTVIYSRIYPETIAVLQYLKTSKGFEYIEYNHAINDPSLALSKHYPSNKDFLDALQTLILKFQ